MNKTELVKAVAAGSGLSLTDASRAVGATIEAITKSMKAGEPVVLPTGRIQASQTISPAPSRATSI